MKTKECKHNTFVFGSMYNVDILKRRILMCGNKNNDF